MATRQGQRGFGVLEAIVATVIMASTGVALLMWTQQSVSDLARLERIQQEVADQRLALAHVQTIDLLERPDGSELVGDVNVAWRVLEASEPQPNATPGGVPGPWRLQRLNTEVSVDRKGGSRAAFQVTLLGRKRTIPVSMEPSL